MPGMRCNIGVCKYRLENTVAGGQQVALFRFPKDNSLREQWVERCSLTGKKYPASIRVCSIHFTDDDFERDLKNELLGLPQKKLLKPGAVPSRYLSSDETSDTEMEQVTKEQKCMVDEILNPTEDDLIVPECEVEIHDEILNQTDDVIVPECDVQIDENTEENSELNTLKYDYQVLMREKLSLEEENKSLREIICNSQVQRREHEEIIKQLKEEIEILKRKNIQQKSKGEAVEINKLLCCLTQNQLDIIVSGKKRVNWTEEEFLKASIIRHYSKRCYFFMKNVLNYPLPGLSTLQKWVAGKECVQLGKYVVIQRQQYMKLHKVTTKASIVLGKDQVDISEIVNRPFWKTYKMEPVADVKRMYKLALCEGATSLSDEIIKEVSSGVDNREIEDDGRSQKLSTEEIISLRDQGMSAHDIVGTLVENSRTFHNKTEYAQEKYLKKKEKKYFEYVTIRKPTFRLVADIIIKQGATQVSGLRMDTLAQITSLGCIQSGGTYLLYESGCQGLVAAHMLNTICDNGVIIHIQPLFTPQKQAVLAMNFTNKQLECLITANVNTLFKKLNKTDDDSVDFTLKDEYSLKRMVDDSGDDQEMKKPRWDIDTDRIVDVLQKRKCDSLVIVCREHPSNIFKSLVKYLNSSRPFVVYFPVREPLQDLFCELKLRHDIVGLRLTESWLRCYQVLPERTHPDVNISGSGGFLLSGTLVES